MRALPVKGLAHITGGGLLDNVPRILGESLVATLDSTAWTRPQLFDWLQREGMVADAEMHRVFNCGIGMVVVVSQEHEDLALKLLREAGETAWTIGMVCRRGADQPQTIVA
jgi:phosphoribosylformylglycinamidine cyclo-ligase